ncbi:MAG: DNA-directed RNA polymerase subunit omega [Lachnospirales bacterium]
MLRPSYSELMDVLNNESHLSNTITSRYTIVIAAAKRARQIIDGSEPLTKVYNHKALSMAVNEMNENKLIITGASKNKHEETINEIFENGNYHE